MLLFIWRDDVYRIAGKAMRNAFLHAEASRIEVEIHNDERQLRLRIRDDGKGIEPQIVTEKGRPGHCDLRGMHERAKRLGGNLEVWSKLDFGTEIEVTSTPHRINTASSYPEKVKSQVISVAHTLLRHFFHS